MPIFMVAPPPQPIKGNTEDAPAVRPRRLEVAGRLKVFTSGGLLANLEGG